MTLAQGIFVSFLLFCLCYHSVTRNAQVRAEALHVRVWCGLLLWWCLNMAGLGIYLIWRALA